MTLYFDTSALIKLVIDEDGSELAVRLWSSRHPAAIGLLAYPEARAALAAARRGRRLTPTGYRTAVTDFEVLHTATAIVAIDHRLARHAGDLAAEHHLRGYDAVHLAGALRLGPRTTLITWDERLGKAAIDTGLGAAPAP